MNSNVNEQEAEHEPGCLEYAVIIAVLIPTVIVMLILGKYDPAKFEQIKQKFGGNNADEAVSK